MSKNKHCSYLAYLVYFSFPLCIFVIWSTSLYLFKGTRLDHLVPFRTRRVLSILLGSLEMCFAGIGFGMNALFPIFQEIGIYGEVCNNTTAGCTEQIIIYANAFTTVCIVPVFIGAVLGFLIDKIGLRVVHLLSTLMNFLGFLLFFFLSPSSAVIIFIGGTLSGIGGCGMLVCTLSVSKLFNRTSSMIATLIQGVYDSSTAVYAFVFLTYQAHFPFKSSLLILAFGCLVTGILNSLFVMSYWMEDMLKYKESANEAIIIESDIDNFEDEELEKIEDQAENIPLDVRTDVVLTDIYPTSRQTLKSLPFLVIVLFSSPAILRFNYFLAELSVVSDHHFRNPSLTAKFNTVITFASACGLPTAFLCGAVVDKLRSKFSPNIENLLGQKKSKERNEAILWYNARPAAISMYIFAVSALILSCLIFIPIEAIYYVNFVFFLLKRGFIFTTNTITTFSLFPVAQFGTMYGVGSAIAGVISCLQYALLKLYPTYADICALLVVVIAFIPPSIIFIMSSKTLKKIPPDPDDFAKDLSDSSQID